MPLVHQTDEYSLWVVCFASMLLHCIEESFVTSSTGCVKVVVKSLSVIMQVLCVTSIIYHWWSQYRQEGPYASAGGWWEGHPQSGLFTYETYVANRDGDVHIGSMHSVLYLRILINSMYLL